MRESENGDLEYGSWKVTKPGSANRREKKSKIVMEEKRQKADRFDTFYKQLGSKCVQEDKRIDYVLVHPDIDIKSITDVDDLADLERQRQLRDKFEFAMKEEGLLIQKVVIDEQVYTKLHCPFRRLCEEAEDVSLEMPLLGVRIYYLLFILEWEKGQKR